MDEKWTFLRPNIILMSFPVFLFCKEFTAESFNALSWWYNNVSSSTRDLGSLASGRHLSNNHCKVPCCRDGPTSTDGSKENGMSIIGNLLGFLPIACFSPNNVSFSITISNYTFFFPASRTCCRSSYSSVLAPTQVATPTSTSFFRGLA